MKQVNSLRQIAKDIYQVRLPLPFALNHVNCYLLAGEEGWTILDTGLNTAEAWAAWQQVFSTLAIEPGAVAQIVLTHVHPDHYGLSGFLQRHFRRPRDGSLPPVILSPREAELAEIIWQSQGPWESELMEFWRRCGTADDLAEAMVESTAATRLRTAPHPETVELLSAGTPIKMGRRHFDTFHMPGHSDGQLIFYDSADTLLLSGDHILKKITSNVGLWPQSKENPLREYLDSLGEVAQMDVRLALPGHGPMMEDLGGRLSELNVHHQERLELTLSSTQAPSTVLDVSQRLFPFERLGVHERRFALAETLAHLAYLRVEGELGVDNGRVWTYFPA